jgi:hypothetical protein
MHVKNADDTLLLKFIPRQEGNNARLVIHKASCLCDQHENSDTQLSVQPYVPLEDVNVNNATTYTELSHTPDYIDIIE